MVKALILGDANCVYVDADAAAELFEPDLVIACNNIGKEWPHVDHWVTLHPKPCPDWVGMPEARRRRQLAKLNDPVTWAHKLDQGIDQATPDWQGSTGLIATKVALVELECTHVVLAGVPMTRDHGHYYDAKQWSQAERYHRGWNKHINEIRSKVRSMSGWTQELLGAPTPEWLGLNSGPSPRN